MYGASTARCLPNPDFSFINGAIAGGGNVSKALCGIALHVTICMQVRFARPAQKAHPPKDPSIQLRGSAMNDLQVYLWAIDKPIPYARNARRIREQFQALETPECPFANLPEARAGRWGEGLTAPKMKQCRWLKPVLAGRFEFVEWTPDKHLRHSRFVVLREGRKPRLQGSGV